MHILVLHSIKLILHISNLKVIIYEAKLGKGEVALLVAFGILLFAIWSNVAAYAQNRTTAANSTSSASSQQRISKVKITSPTRGQQIPVGKDLTISGTSIDNATSNCQVSVIVNNVSHIKILLLL